jgi:tetratricopeptide (TPR) repeat protein
MKKIAVLSLSALFLTACGGTGQQTVNSNAVPPPAIQNTSNQLVVSSHSTPNSAAPNATVVPKSETKTKWTQSGNPIDTSKFDAEIAEAEKDLKAKPNDEKVKKALAISFVNRGLALTDARQYASALGDYRRAQKLDPTNDEAKKWIEQIISIYDSINKEFPKEGEEPPPLPFKKES